MRHRLLGLLVAALALGGAACNGITEVQADQPFELQVGQTAALPDGSAALRFVSVPTDSRCPMGVMCIWAGDAVVHLEVLAEADTSSVDLHTNPGAGSASARVGAWSVELQGLKPLKKAGEPIPPGDYVATLTARQ